MAEPFRFHSRLNLVYITPRKAANAQQLLEGIREVPGSSIYYHTHHFLQQHEYLSPEPPDDFAYWLRNILQNEVLGERIAALDLRRFNSIEEIRSRIIEVMEEGLRGMTGSDRNVPPGNEFCFMKARTFVFPTRFFAQDLGEFRDCLQHVSIHSLYYHMFESRLRLQRDTSDFSVWLRDALGQDHLAEEIDRMDPYTQTLEGLRKHLIAVITGGLENK